MMIGSQQTEVAGAMRAGIFAISEGQIKRNVLIIEGDQEAGEGRHRDVFWVEELAMMNAVIDEEGYWKPRQMSSEALVESQDITEQYFNTPFKLNFLLAHVPGWVEIILLARPELKIPPEVIKQWLGSPKKYLREMGIKFLGQMDRP